MAFRQTGYPNSRRVAERSDSHFDRIRDRPASQLVSPDGDPARSTSGRSAVGIPGYYASQRGLTRETYRRLAALAAADREGTPDWWKAQGMTEEDYTALAGNVDALNARVPVPNTEAPALKGFKVSLEKEDVSFLETVRREKQAEAFDQWLVRQVDFDVPENQRWLQEIYPEFFSRREAFIDDKINLEARLAKIRLRGYRNAEDLKLLYAVQKGLISPPTGPLFGPDAGGPNFTKGIFSVLGFKIPQKAEGANVFTGLSYAFTPRATP